MKIQIQERSTIPDDSTLSGEGTEQGIHLKGWNLAFSGPHAHMEKMFHEFYRPTSMNYVRFILIAATVLYAVFGIMDAVLIPSHRHWMWTTHIALLCLGLLSAAVFSFHPRFSKVSQPLFLALIVLCGMSAITMSAITPSAMVYAYFNGLVLIIFFGYAITFLRFLWAVSQGWTLGILYVAAMVISDAPPKRLIFDGFYLIAVNLVGMLACYLTEYRARRYFYVIHILDQEERKVKRANLELENKVEERTADLLTANQKLETTIEEHKRIAGELAQSEKKYRELVETTPDLIFTVDRRGYFTFINPQFEKVVGYPLGDLAGKPFIHIIPKKFKQLTVDRFVRGMRGKQTGPYVAELISRKGKRIPVEFLVTTLLDAAGRPVGRLGIGRDITERERLEAQLIRAQRMESIGTLAGGIAHDFNNILSAIMGYTEMAMAKLPKSQPEHLYLTRVFRASERARDLVKQILDFSRQSKQEAWPLRLTTVVKEALKLLRASIPATIRIVQKMETEKDLIMADPTQIHQVIMNLCTNAAHAMRQGGGVLTVRLTHTTIYSHSVKPISDMTVGPYVVLSVGDTGHGIDAAIMDRIFDPFFTTKERGEGTGMGLSVVHGIVKSHGGAVTVESRSGRGTTFHVYLPFLEEKVVAPTADVGARAVGGDERILFVDDEPELVHLIQEMLTDLGYRVTSLTSSLKALALFREDPQQFDLVVTDQTMPDMTGMDLARRMLTIRPDIPIILCTGFMEPTSPEEVKTIGIRDYIIKPILQRHLSATIRRVVEPASTEDEEPWHES